MSNIANRFLTPANAEPAHPCLTTLKPIASPSFQPQKTDFVDFKISNWYPLGLLIEPLATNDLNKQRWNLTHQWMNDAPQGSDNPLSIYRKPKIKVDRYGRHALVPAKITKKDTSILQDVLLEQGLSRVDVTGLTIQCAFHFLTLEERARKMKRGLWADPAYKIQNAHDLHLSAKISTYQIVSGTIASVSRNPKKISYLNFGNHWKQDFTASLSATLLKLWERQGHSLDELDGQTVYVRGWIENRDGALIRIKHPQQLHYKFEDPLSEAQ